MSAADDPMASELDDWCERYVEINKPGAMDLDALLGFADTPVAELRSGAPLTVLGTTEEAKQHFSEMAHLLHESGLGALEIPRKTVWSLGPDLAMLSVDYERQHTGGGEPISGRVLYLLTKRTGEWKYVFYTLLEPGFDGPDVTPASGAAGFTGLTGSQDQTTE